MPIYAKSQTPSGGHVIANLLDFFALLTNKWSCGVRPTAAKTAFTHRSRRVKEASRWYLAAYVHLLGAFITQDGEQDSAPDTLNVAQ